MKFNDNQQWVIVMWAICVFMGLVPSYLMPYTINPNYSPSVYYTATMVYLGVVATVFYLILLLKFRSK